MIFKFLSSLYHLLWSFSGAVLFGFPSRKLYCVGVTGTKGKSSTIEVIAAILEEAGYKTALNSSVRAKIAADSVKNTSNNSMPGRWALQKFLWQAHRAGCKVAIIEVTSQGVLQHRDRFIAWNAGVFLNLSPEHIEAHGSFENYRAAKVAFFKHASVSNKKNKVFVINRDDENSKYFEEAINVTPGTTVTSFSLKDALSTETKDVLTETLGNPDFSSGEERKLISPWLVPEFNLENALAAAALCRELGIGGGLIMKVLKKFEGIPGRMEYVQKEPFGVVVDYAHTPDSLEKVYKTLKAEIANTEGKLICVLGSCGGGRDVWKRPVMGKLAGEYCDEIFLTNEDPYNEDPKRIISDIQTGVRRSASSVHVTLDRGEAIAGAMYSANPGDIVIITGKGSEAWLHEAKGKRIPWSDSGEVKKVLTLLSNKSKTQS